MKKKNKNKKGVIFYIKKNIFKKSTFVVVLLWQNVRWVVVEKI